jgi:predicted amino acid-binding ACT domain protein
MLVLDYLRELQWPNVSVAIYHRAHLSLVPGTMVYVAPIIRPAAPGHFVELFGTTVHPNSWRTSYRLSAALHDGTGVLQAVVDCLARYDINVLHLDASSMEQESVFQVEMVLDFPRDQEQQEMELDRSEELAGWVLAECHQHIVREHGVPRIQVTPVRSLRKAIWELGSLRGPSHKQPWIELEIQKDGSLTPPESIAGLLRASFVQDDGTVWSPSTYWQYVISDTRDRVFRVYLSTHRASLLWCAIQHTDRPGALSAITKKLSNAGITILAALNRVESHQGRNWFEVLLSHADWSAVSVGDDSIHQVQLEQLLDDQELRRFACKPFFSLADSKKAMRASPVDGIGAGPWRPQGARGRDAWIEKTARLAHSTSSGIDLSWDRQTRQRRAAAHSNLVDGLRRFQRAINRLPRRVFVSMELTDINKVRAEILRKVAATRGVEIDVVDSPKGRSRRIAGEVLARLRDCSHFLGVWTPWSKASDESTRPSPWCGWELGAAQALGLPSYILLEKNTKADDHIEKDLFYAVFSSVQEFESTAEAAVDEFLREARERVASDADGRPGW